MQAKGLFITIEGIDGSGKSTVIEELGRWLTELGRTTVVTAEPTKTRIGQLLRASLQEEESFAPLDALLFAADRLKHCKQLIQPHLDQNHIVLCDRYIDSSLVYQSVQFGNEFSPVAWWLYTINRFAILPDTVLLLDVSPAVALDRLHRTRERFETETFLEEVRAKYLEIAAAGENYHIINAEQGSADVLLAAKEKIWPLLEQGGP